MNTQVEEVGSTDLISKKDLLKSVMKLKTHLMTRKDLKVLTVDFDTVLDLINSAPVVSGDAVENLVPYAWVYTNNDDGRSTLPMLTRWNSKEADGFTEKTMYMTKDGKSYIPPQPQSVRDVIEKAAKIVTDELGSIVSELRINYKIRALIEHDAPSAPIEGKQKVMLTSDDTREIWEQWHHAEETTHGLYMRFKRAEQALIQSTQAHKESED